MATNPKVLVLGGGFAGLESAFYLRYKLDDKVDLTLVSAEDHFLFKPNTIYIPFGEDPDKSKIYLDKPTRRRDIEFIRAEVKAIDPENKLVELENRKLGYDFLIVAIGAGMRPEEIPGFKEHALAVWTTDQMLQLRGAFERLVKTAREGQRQKLLFLVPPNDRCSGPLYEIVMMTDTWLRRQKVREQIEITWTTFEEGFLQAFGPRLNTVVSDEFEERGIHGLRGFVVTAVEPEVVEYQNSERREYDLLVSFPPYVAARQFPALPIDDRGFIHVEADSRRVKGHADLFAVGDAADFPIKRAFLALLQADAAADHLAAEIAGEKPEVDFEPMSMCVMEELNKATFAQVPLKYTDDPTKPIAVDTEDAENYKVGVSPIWRVGKMALGLYLPWRFGSGKPFHAGLAWDAMDLGLKVMSKLLAK